MTPEQKEAIERANAVLSGMSRGGETEKPTGFLDTTYNTVARGLSNLGNIPNVSKAEAYSALADGEAQRDAEIASGEMPWWEKVLTAKFPWAAKDDPDDLYQKGAEYAMTAQEKAMAAQENYPMSEKGEAAVSNILGAESFGEGLMTALKNPLDTASGVAQVAGEQIPTIGAALALRNPKLGISTFAGSGYLQERYGQLVPEANAEGYNLLDKSDALRAVKDRDFMERQQERGEVRGGIIGAVDLVTAGLASKTPLTKLGLAKNTGAQVVGGGGGEALAEYVDTGTINPGEVIIEGLAEGVSAPLDVAAFKINNSETKLDVDSVLAKENAKLEKAADAEAQQAQVAQAEALVVKNRSLREAAKEFTPKEKFVKARQVADSSQLKLDAANPETEIGKAVEDNLDAKGLYDPNEVAKETAAFLKSYEKDRAAEALDTYNAEYQAALEKFASAPQAVETEVAPEQASEVEVEATPKYTADTVIRSRKKAIEKAEELLGKDFADKPEFDAVASAVNGDKFKVKTFEEALSGALNPQALDEGANALTSEATQTQPIAEEVKTLEQLVQRFKDNPNPTNLSAGQKEVFTFMREKLLNNEEEAFQDAKGSFLGANVSENTKIKSRGAAGRAREGLRGKIDTALGLPEGTTARILRETKIQKVEAAIPADAPVAVLDKKELSKDRTMGSGASANQGAGQERSQAELNKVNLEAAKNINEEPLSVKRGREERDRADQEIERLNSEKGKELWQAGVSKGGVKFNKLAARDKMEWLNAVQEFRNGTIDEKVLNDDLREIENKYDQDNAGPTLDEANPDNTTSGSVEEVFEGDDVGKVMESFAAEELNNTKWENDYPELVQLLKDKNYPGFQANVIRIKAEIDAKDDAKLGITATPPKTASRANFEKITKKLTGGNSNMRIRVFNTEADAYLAIDNGDVPKMDIDRLKKSGAYGWVSGDENGRPVAQFILNRISEGREMSAFMHEVGGHIGIDSVIDKVGRRDIRTQIEAWSESNDSSLENTVARAAVGRLANAQIKDKSYTDQEVTSELVAYFLEEAAIAGVEPSTDSAVGKFVKQLKELFAAALEKLGFDTSELSTQDIVDLAAGAAYLELNSSGVNTSTDPGTVKFSVPKKETKKETKKHISWVRKNLGDDAAAMLTNLKTVAETPVDVTKNLDRTVRDNEAKMPSARKWYDLMLEAEATKNEVLMMVESVINQARKFSMERKELINDFIGSSTFYQKWGYDPQWTDRKTGKPVAVVIDPVMKKKYDRLSAEEQQLVRDLFSHGRTMQIMMQDIAENLGVSKFFTFDSKLAGPYSPLKRFGKYVGELKSQKLLDAEESLAQSPTAANRKRVEELKVSPDDYVISFFESLGAADTFVVANQNKFASAEASEKSVSFDDARPGGAQAYAKILGAVNANLAGLDQPSKDAMAKMIKDMYFQTLDDSNARLSGTKRLNRAGFDKDMLRAFADHGMAQSSLLAQMKHGGEISAALVEARKEAKANPRELLPVYNKIALKFQRVMTPRTGMLATVQANIMKVNSLYMLTSSIGYMLQNMTQPYFAVANIAKVSGFADQPAVWGRLFSGYKVAKEVVNTSFLNQVKNVASFGLLGGNSTVELNLNKAAPELQPVLKQLQLRGLLDVGVTEDLRHVNMSPNMVIRGYDEITHRLYQSSRYVEANNRIASAVAAFKTAQRNPKKMKQLKMTPTEFAVRIVQDTQGNFSQLDAPALFDGNLKLPFQFRKYQMQMGWLHVDATKDALKGADPETKQAGWRVLSLMLGYTGVFGGLAAIPMSNFATAILQAAIGWASGDGDEENPPKGLERWIRENVEDERMATLLARGVPAALGWDFSQKLDQSDLFMPYNSKYVTANPDRDGALLFAAQLFLGPTGTTLGNIGNSMDFVNRGNIPRAAEYALPKGLRSYLETYRYATRGYETRDKTKITDPTSFNVVDFLTNVVGLPSTDINQIKWTRGQQVEITQWFSKRTSAITRGYLAAYDARDRKAQAKYRDEFRELQKAKDRVRPFFNNSRRVLTRSPVSDLIKAPRNRQTKQLRMDSITGR